jgi:hypothetical protein
MAETEAWFLTGALADADKEIADGQITNGEIANGEESSR